MTEEQKNVTRWQSETVTEQNSTAAPTDEQKQPETPPTGATVEPSTPEPPKPKESYIYIGPPLPGGALPTNRIFQGSIEEIETLLADVLGKYPKIKHLIVPSYNLSSSKVKVRAANNILGRYYNELRAEFAKGILKGEGVNGV